MQVRIRNAERVNKIRIRSEDIVFVQSNGGYMFNLTVRYYCARTLNVKYLTILNYFGWYLNIGNYELEGFRLSENLFLYSSKHADNRKNLGVVSPLVMNIGYFNMVRYQNLLFYYNYQRQGKYKDNDYNSEIIHYKDKHGEHRTFVFVLLEEGYEGLNYQFKLVKFVDRLKMKILYLKVV